MNPVLFCVTLIIGCTFILLGRWAYRNPRKLYPNALYTNPDSPFLTTPVKIFSILLIFVGSYALLSAIGGLVLHDWAILLFAAPAAIAATWILRPKLAAAETAAIEGAPSHKSAGFLTKKGKWFVAVSIGVAVLSGLLLHFWFRR